MKPIDFLLLLTSAQYAQIASSMPGAIICASKGGTDLIPHQRTCAQAISNLPSKVSTGTFCRCRKPFEGPDFCLSLKHTVWDCEVFVDLVQNYPSEKSSWIAIGLAATLLNTVCVNPDEGLVGGRIVTGDEGHVEILIKGTRRGPYRNSSMEAVDSS